MTFRLFMEIEGITGSEKIGNYSGQIPIEQYNFGVKRFLRSNTLGNGRNKEFGVPNLTTMTITKEYDASSTKIMSSALLSKGKTIKIRVVKSADGKNEHILKTITLSSAVLTSYDIHGKEENIEEHIEINFAKFNIDYKPVASEGKAAGNPSSIGYDTVKVKKT